MNKLKTVLTDKRVIAAVVTIGVVVAGVFGLDLDQATVDTVTNVLTAIAGLVG